MALSITRFSISIKRDIQHNTECSHAKCYHAVTFPIVMLSVVMSYFVVLSVVEPSARNIVLGQACLPQRSAAQHGTAFKLTQNIPPQHSIDQNSTAQNSAEQYRIAQYSTVQHSTA
jgi:hypothetical protein